MRPPLTPADGNRPDSPEVPESTRGGLLLYSLAAFREIILGCLDLIEGRSVTEIGGEDGTFTRELLSWAEGRDGRVACIDPSPSDALAALVENAPAGELHRSTSLEALPGMDPSDVYLVDGDHNYYTLVHELEVIEAISGGDFPLVFVHDVGWPSGRRDMYYAPDTLPAEARHPYDYDKGVTVGNGALITGGFQGMGEFAWALSEGGPANGVLTAVEKFLADRPHLELAVVPCVFGLGVVYARSAPWAGSVAEFLSHYDRDPLLERLEQNRLDLYLQVLKLQEDLDGAGLRMRDLDVENRALWARVHELERQMNEVTARARELAAEVTTTVTARSFSVAERLSRLHSRGGGPGVSGARLRALADSASEPTAGPTR